MAYDFKRLSDVEAIEEFPEGAAVLIENSGEIKKCAVKSLGGSSYDAEFYIDELVDGEPTIELILGDFGDCKNKILSHNCVNFGAVVHTDIGHREQFIQVSPFGTMNYFRYYVEDDAFYIGFVVHTSTYDVKFNVTFDSDGVTLEVND